jgi:iron complex outermembrane recepter protein
MRMSRMALAVAGAFPFVLGITYAGASSAFAQTAHTTRSTVDVLYGPFSAAYALVPAGHPHAIPHAARPHRGQERLRRLAHRAVPAAQLLR